MKIRKLVQLTSIIFASATTGTAFAAAEIVEKTGDKLTSVSDSIFGALTGKNTGFAPVVAPVSLYNYEQASSAYEDAYFNGRLDVRDGNQDQTSYNLDLGANYERVNSSVDTNTKYQADTSYATSRAGTDGADRAEIYTANGSITHDSYFNPKESKLFWYGKGELNLQNEAPTDYAGIKNPRTTATAGIGYGRVVNVTPMAKSIRLIEALVERNIITVPSATVYNSVAEIITRESEYRSKFGGADYAQRWVMDIEKALGTSIGAQGAIQAYNVLTSERISTRKYGWDVRAGVGAVLTDFDGNNGKPVLEAEANYYYPISNRTQFSNETRFKAILDDNNDSYVLSNGTSVTYEVSDRVDWLTGLKINYISNQDANDVTSYDLSSTYRYFVSNAISFDTTLFAKKVDDGMSNNGNDKVDTGLLMGMTYRLR